MILLEQLASRIKARNTLTEYCRYIAPQEPPAEHHRILCNALDKVVEGEIRNLMVFMPPGSAKSTYASVRFPAYYLGRLETRSIICASYSGDLSKSWGRKVRNLVDSKESQNVFPGLRLTEDSKAKGEWETEQGGVYYACGVDGAVTGRRADLGLIDDPVKGRKEADSDVIKLATWQWYNTDFMTRLKPNAAQVIIQTRWVDDDLSGRLLPEDWDGESGIFTGTDGKEWIVINIQAESEKGKNDPLNREPGEYFWLDYFTPKFWKETKTAQQRADARNWGALYQGRPTQDEGTYFKRDWFNRYELGTQPDHLSIYGASDYAVSDDDNADFTEQGVAGLSPDSKLYMLDWIQCQEESDVWVDDLLDLTQKWGPLLWGAEVGQIKKAVNPWLTKRMRQRKIWLNVEPMPHVGDKAANARSFQAIAKQGMVYIPLCEWGDELIRQLLKFPAGAYDDKVDVCGIMGRLIHRIFEISPKVPEKKKYDGWERSFGIDDADDWKTV